MVTSCTITILTHCGLMMPYGDIMYNNNINSLWPNEAIWWHDVQYISHIYSDQVYATFVMSALGMRSGITWYNEWTWHTAWTQTAQILRSPTLGWYVSCNSTVYHKSRLECRGHSYVTIMLYDIKNTWQINRQGPMCHWSTFMTKIWTLKTGIWQQNYQITSIWKDKF